MQQSPFFLLLFKRKLRINISCVYVECIPIQGTPKQSVLLKFLFFWKGDLKGSSITSSSPYISVIDQIVVSLFSVHIVS